MEHHLKRTLIQDEPEFVRCGRVATLWVHWVHAYGTVYFCGVQATWWQIRELVDAEPDVEYAPTEHLEALLVPPSYLATLNAGNSTTFLWISIQLRTRYDIPRRGY